jgi:hypothetical protein
MITAEIFQRLKPLSKTDRLLPGGGGDEFKAPLLKDWPNKPGQSIEQLKRWRGLRSIGIAMDHLVCADVDGITAVERLRTLGLLEPELINTWRIDRDNDLHKFKLIGRPTAEQLRSLPKQYVGKDKTKPPVMERGEVVQKGEGVDQFALHKGRQVVVIGRHYSGGNYCWPDGQGPEALATLPCQWFDYLVEEARDYPKPAAGAHRTVSTGRGDWHRLDDCPVCHRRSNPVCQLHRDGRTLRCYRGATYGPPLDLQKGQLAPGTQWAFSKTQQVDFGTFSVFALHQPNNHQRLREWLRNG